MKREVARGGRPGPKSTPWGGGVLVRSTKGGDPKIDEGKGKGGTVLTGMSEGPTTGDRPTGATGERDLPPWGEGTTLDMDKQSCQHFRFVGIIPFFNVLFR